MDEEKKKSALMQYLARLGDGPKPDIDSPEYSSGKATPSLPEDREVAQAVMGDEAKPMAGDKGYDSGATESTSSPLDFLPYAEAAQGAVALGKAALRSGVAKDLGEYGGRMLADQAGELRFPGVAKLISRGEQPASSVDQARQVSKAVYDGALKGQADQAMVNNAVQSEGSALYREGVGELNKAAASKRRMDMLRQLQKKKVLK